MRNQSAHPIECFLSASLLAGILLVLPGIAQGSTQAQDDTEKDKPAASTPSTGKRPHDSDELTPSARKYYQSIWGVDILGVKPVSSGAMIRFSYRVLDAKKAGILNDKMVTPLLIDHATRAQLVIPTMEKVGQLRQTSTPENGREYWMLFSNKGNLVKPGSRVDVVIGNFRADGLIVQAQ